MALIKCEECGKMISDKAQKCPQCGFPVIKQRSILICPECGNNVSEDNNTCPTCGCPSSMFEHSLTHIKDNSNEVKNNKLGSYENQKQTPQGQKETDIFAIIAFASALISLLVLPILFVPISFISNLVSYYKLKENPNLKGWGLKIAAAILSFISLGWYFYMLKNY